MTLQQSPSSRLPKQPLNPLTQNFDYTALDTETRIVVQQRTTEIKSLIRHTAQGIFEIGEKLIEVKQKLGHGYFSDWLKAEFDWGEWTARKFMQVARKFKSVNFTDLDIAASALYILAADSTPEAARLEALERASLGEPISHSKAQEIANRYKTLTQPTQKEPVTIDVDAETVGRESSAPISLEKTSVEHSKLNKPLLGEEKQSEVDNFEVGDRVRILKRQNGIDQWAGKTATVWEVTIDGLLRVKVEEHPSVRFTLRPEWVERVEVDGAQTDALPIEQGLRDEYSSPPGELNSPQAPYAFSSPISIVSEENYTPCHILVNAVLACLGEIDLIVCSNSHYTLNIPARQHFTQGDNGLTHNWRGKVYAIPPCGDAVKDWVEKLCTEFDSGRVTQALALVATHPDSQWFRRLRQYPRCFITEHLNFSDTDNSAPSPVVMFYLGRENEGFQRFVTAFEDLGDIFTLVERSTQKSD